ncbi:MAG TPA: hypothetical protein PKD68_00535 [Candidatus Saccharibacteria bacterium]|nr:hypothetical protein [Candidatus Saccharibacteria bacterium]
MAIDVIYEPQVEYFEGKTPDQARVSTRTGKLAMASTVRFGGSIPNLDDWNHGPNVPEMQWPGMSASVRASFEERNRDALAQEYAAGYTDDLA